MKYSRVPTDKEREHNEGVCFPWLSKGKRLIIRTVFIFFSVLLIVSSP